MKLFPLLFARFFQLLYARKALLKSGKTKCSGPIKRNVIFSSKTKCNKIKNAHSTKEVDLKPTIKSTSFSTH